MTKNFLYHKVSEKEKTQIKKQAKEIMDSFSKAIEKVTPIKKPESKEPGYREQGEGEKTDEEFRKIMFQNAPKTKNKFIQVEKVKW